MGLCTYIPTRLAYSDWKYSMNLETPGGGRGGLGPPLFDKPPKLEAVNVSNEECIKYARYPIQNEHNYIVITPQFMNVELPHFCHAVSASANQFMPRKY